MFIYNQMILFDSNVLMYPAQKMKFYIKDLVTLTEEILNRKFHF